MKRFFIIALILLGAATCLGLGVLFYEASAGFVSRDSVLLITVLVMAVAASLFVFGIFLGYLYSKTIQQRRADREAKKRFQKAIGFERSERLRLERELFDAKHTIVSLKDQLSKEFARFGEPGSKEKNEQSSDRKKKIEELTSIQENLRQDLIRRKERITGLLEEVTDARAETLEAKTEAKEIRASLAPPPPKMDFLLNKSTLGEVLESIASLKGVQMALVADDHGLVVDAAGEGMSSERLAAISSLVVELGPKVREIFPMGEVSSISLGDDAGLVLDTRYFDLLGTRCAFAIARNENHQYPELAKKAIESILTYFEN